MSHANDGDPSPSLQERYAPDSICFGCGPANPGGLHVGSFPDGDEVIGEWAPGPHHEAFPGVLNGGIIGTLLDCHTNWTAAHHLMVRDALAKPPVTVTAEYTVQLRRPTDSGAPVGLRARVAESSGPRVIVEAELESGGEVTATCRGIFIAVREGHPAYHSW